MPQRNTSPTLSVLFGALLLLLNTASCVPEDDLAADDSVGSDNSALRIGAYSLDSAKGDTSCAWGSPNCNRCVNDVPGQLDSIANSYKTASRIRFDGYAWGFYRQHALLNRINNRWGYEHIQGVGRIAGVGNNEFIAFTHSTNSGDRYRKGALAIVRIGANQTSQGYAFASYRNLAKKDGPDESRENRTVTRTHTGNNHPGGMSVLGKYVYVAQWCQPEGNPGQWCAESLDYLQGMGFSVYDVSNAANTSSVEASRPVHRYYKHVYAEPWMEASSTTAVAAARTSTGGYLVALSRSNGYRYGFYTSTSPTGPFTFRNWASPVTGGQNANLVTECGTGDMYLFQTGGTGDKVDLYKLKLNYGQYGLDWVKTRFFECKGSSVDGSGDWCNFNAGTGIYVKPNGRLTLYATDREQAESTGNVRMVEFN